MTPELVSVQNREGHSPVRTYRFECGHETKTALLIPPKECPTCKQERLTRDIVAGARRAVLSRNRRWAAEMAEKAHSYHLRHLICDYCIESVKADMYVFGERMADVFSARKIRGFKR